MPTIRYDVSEVEGGGEQPKPDIYKAEITEVEHRTERADGTKIDGKGDLHVVLNVGSDYARLHTYVGMYDATAWKLAEFVRALGLNEKGSINTSKLVGQKLRVQVVKDEYEGAYKARVKTFLQLKDDEDEDEEEADDEDEVEEEESDEEDEADEEEEDEEEEDEDEEEPEDEDPLAEMTRAELKKYIKEKELEVKVTTKMSDDDIRDKIRDADGDDYDDWSLGELKEQLEQRGLELAKGKKATKANLIAALRADDSEEPF